MKQWIKQMLHPKNREYWTRIQKGRHTTSDYFKENQLLLGVDKEWIEQWMKKNGM